MKTRTAFKLHNDGVVRCWCGHITAFAEDLHEFIIPMLDYSIDAEFNGRIRTINKYDDVDSIRKKFMNALG